MSWLLQYSRTFLHLLSPYTPTAERRLFLSVYSCVCFRQLLSSLFSRFLFISENFGFFPNTWPKSSLLSSSHLTSSLQITCLADTNLLSLFKLCDVHFETNLFRRNLQLLHHFPQLLYITAYQQDVVNGVKIISMWSIDNNDLKMFSSARVNNLGDMVSPWSTSRSICIFSVSRFLLILTWNVVFWYFFTVLASSKVSKIANVSI